MVPTRRQALRSAAALLAALAGCSSTTETPTPADGGGNRFERPENVAMDPPSVELRRPGSRDPIVEVPDAGEGLNRTERERRRAVERGFVTGPEEASLLRIDDDIEGADDARQFLAETDFDESFVFVDRSGVAQCYRRVLCYVTWTEFELERTYAEVYREFDVPCNTDERDRVARFVRLDGSVDPREIESGGTSTHRGGCPVPRWRLDDRDENRNRTTPADETAAADSDARLAGWER